MAAKRRLAALAFATLATACYDGSIEVRFELPSDAPEVESFELVVYAEATGPISCDELAFDEIPLDVLATTEVFRATTTPDVGIGVSGVPRKGKKLFFAEALLRTGASIFAGCQEIGEIEGPTVVDIEPFLRTNLSFDSGLIGRDAAGGGEIIDVDVTVVRLNGAPLDNAPVRWRLRGADTTGLFESSGAATANSSGRAQIVIPQADRPLVWGPVELDVRSQWAQSQAKPLTAFLDPQPLEAPVAADVGTLAVARGNDILEVGRLEDDAPPSIVVLAAEAAAGGGREQTNAHVYTLDSGALARTQSIPLGDRALRGARTLGKVRFPSRDRIITVWENDSGERRWTDIGLLPQDNFEITSPFSELPIKLGAAGGCDGTVEGVLFAQIQDTPLAIEAATPFGNGIEGIPPLTGLGAAPELIEIGCVRDTLNILRTLFVYDTSMSTTQFSAFTPQLRIYDPMDRQVFGGSVNVKASTAWIGEFSSTAEAAMLLGELTPEGPATSRYFLQPAVNSVTADFQGGDPTPSIVIATAEGDINGDEETDVVSLLLTGTDVGAVRVLVHVSMAIANSETRLRGTMNETITTIGPRLRIADLNGDSIDDIIVGSADTLRVFLMGAR